MEQFNVGSKIIAYNKEYVIVDILEENNKEYLFCCTTSEKKEPEIFEYKDEDKKIMIRRERSLEIVSRFARRILKEM